MKILATLVVSLGFINLVVAQQPLGEEDHYKYWRMRARLRNHFVAVGYEKGTNVNSTTSIYGIPADSKMLVQDELDRISANDSSYKLGELKENTPYTSYDLQWGDVQE